MPDPKNIKGQKFGRLTAVRRRHTDHYGYSHWVFQCECGNKVVCSGSSVWRGRKKSCGCLKRETKPGLTHGHKYTRIYNIWSQMKNRSHNKGCNAYKRYGGRGIKVCKRWLLFENFLKDMGYPPNIHHTLDRINNDRGYKPSNCRWATKKEQNRNASTNVLRTIKGDTKCLSEWAELYEIPYLRLWDRHIKSGWSLMRALTEPVHIEKIRH